MDITTRISSSCLKGCILTKKCAASLVKQEMRRSFRVRETRRVHRSRLKSLLVPQRPSMRVSYLLKDLVLLPFSLTSPTSTRIDVFDSMNNSLDRCASSASSVGFTAEERTWSLSTPKAGSIQDLEASASGRASAAQASGDRQSRDCAKRHHHHCAARHG